MNTLHTKNTNGKIKYDDLVNMYNKLKPHINNIPYGFVCSEETAILLRKHFENVSDQSIPNLATISGLKVKVIDTYLFADAIWVLNKENYEEVEKNGIESLMRKMARANNIKLWGLDDLQNVS